MNNEILYAAIGLGAIPALSLSAIYWAIRQVGTPSVKRIQSFQADLDAGRSIPPIKLSVVAFNHTRSLSQLANMAIAKYQSLRGHQRIINYIALVSESDVNGNITFVNDTFCRVSGYSREELLGQNHRILRSGRHDESFYRDMFDTMSRGMVWRGDICNRNYNGSEYWCLLLLPRFKLVAIMW